MTMTSKIKQPLLCQEHTRIMFPRDTLLICLIMIWNLLLITSLLGSLVAQSWLMSELRTVDTQSLRLWASEGTSVCVLVDRVHCVPHTCWELEKQEWRGYGLHCIPWKMCQSLNPPALVDAPLFGNRVSADVIRLQMRSLEWPQSNTTAVLPRGGGILGQTQERRTPCNRRRQNAKGCSCEPREPRTAGNPSESSKRQGKMLPSGFQEEPDHADTLISDFSLQNGEMSETSLLFQATWFVTLVSAALGNGYRELGKLPMIPGRVMPEDTPEHNPHKSHSRVSPLIWPLFLWGITAKLYARVFSYILFLFRISLK